MVLSFTINYVISWNRICHCIAILFQLRRRIKISKEILIDFIFFLFSDDIIKLSREMSSHHLIHSIHNFVEDLEERIYDNLKHQNLYMLDLDCDYAIEILRQVPNAHLPRAQIQMCHHWLSD